VGNWSKEIVVKLAKYVSLEDVPKLQGCYLVALKDPNIILGVIKPHRGSHRKGVHSGLESLVGLICPLFVW
jgi:hypothetical protein